MDFKNINKILLITLSNLGDAVLTLPVLDTLCKNFVYAKLHVIAGPNSFQVFNGDPRIERVFVYKKDSSLKEKLDFIKTLRAGHYDLAVDLRNTVIPFLISAKHRVPGIFFTSPQKTLYKKDLHLSKLKPLELKIAGDFNMYIPKQNEENIDKRLSEQGISLGDILIGVAPGSKSLIKRWKKSNFIEVCRALVREDNVKIVLIGDENDRLIAKDIKDSMRNNIVDFTGLTAFGELVSLIKRLNLLISNDSAPMHISVAVGTPVIAIFGPTDPREYGPRGKRDIVINKDLDCSPCKRSFCQYNLECMKGILPEEVVLAVRKILYG